MEAFSLSDRVALVTGASRGIGAAIARKLAEAGATVIVNYRGNTEAAERVVDEIRTVSPKSEAIQFDVSKVGEVEAAIADITKKHGGIHVLVCNAGISKDSLLPRAKVEDFQEILNTNLLGTFNVVRVVSRPMMKQRFGRIVCVSSVLLISQPLYEQGRHVDGEETAFSRHIKWRVGIHLKLCAYSIAN